MVGYTLGDGTWRAVWNHWDGHTQHLGRWIIGQIKKGKGDLSAFCAQRIDVCPEGWSSLAKDERSDEHVGFLAGAFDGVIARCDATANPLCFDAHFLYLIHAPKRRLYVFEVADGPMRPFGMITFDAVGQSTPRALPKTDE